MKHALKLLVLLTIVVPVTILATACSSPTEARIYTLDRVTTDWNASTNPTGTPATTSHVNTDTRLTFAGNQVSIRINGVNLVANIAPSTSHTSYNSAGGWHHHLYNPTAPGQRVNFYTAFPDLDITDNGATDNTASAYQRANLHLMQLAPNAGQYRLQITIDGVVYNLFFAAQ